MLLRAFLVLLAAFWVLLAPFFVLLAARGCLLGGSWVSFGRLLEPPGRLLGLLGRLLGPLGAILKFESEFGQILAPQRVPKGSQKGAKMAPKWDPKRTKIEDKFRYRKKTSSRPSWGRLGAILGHFRSPPGVKNDDFSFVFKAFRENSLFSKNIASRAILDRSWADFGPTWAAKWVRNGTPNGPKFDEKNMLKINEI